MLANPAESFAFEVKQFFQVAAVVAGVFHGLMFVFGQESFGAVVTHAVCDTP